jgi:hypothetical protein
MMPRLCLNDFAGAEASGADSHALDAAINERTDALQVRLKFALGDFDHVHTDTALFLGQTAASDVTAESLVFAADFATLTHFLVLLGLLLLLYMKMLYGK